MRRFRLRRRFPRRQLVIVIDGLERRLEPGDILYLTHRGSWDADDHKRGSASVTIPYDWDGERLVARR